MRQIFFTLAGLLMSFGLTEFCLPAFADSNRPACTKCSGACSDPQDSSIASFLRLNEAYKNSGLSQDFLEKEGLHRTAQGLMVHHTCFKDVDEARKNEMLSRLEQTLSYMSVQTDRCHTLFGDENHLDDFKRIPDFLSRTVLRCRPQVGAMALTQAYRTKAQEVVDVGGLPLALITVNMDYGNFLANPLYAFDRRGEELASILAHEALHGLSRNYQPWHNHFKTEGKKFEGCADSIFEDRIYLLQAACFPRSSVGEDFYFKGAAKCENLCRKALHFRFDRSDRTTALAPLPNDEKTYDERFVNESCGRMKAVSERLERANVSIAQAEETIRSANVAVRSESLLSPLPQAGQERVQAFLQKLNLQIIRQKNFSDNLPVFQAEVEDLKKEFKAEILRLLPGDVVKEKRCIQINNACLSEELTSVLTSLEESLQSLSIQEEYLFRASPGFR
jgi:hypothetical protein